MIRFPFAKPRPRDLEAANAPGDEPARAEAEQDADADAASPRLREPETAAEMERQTDDLEGAQAQPQEAAAEAEDDALAIDGVAGEEAGVAPPMSEQVRMVEAMLFASETPLSTAELASRMPIGCDAAVAVRRLEDAYASRGVHLARVAGKWAFRTAPDLAHLLTGETVETRKLSRAALETLAIIAYHQPVTRAEIEEIRQVGVSKGTVDLLMELQWIKLGRRRQTPGRPVTFVTTEKFLEHFGLESVKDLPRLDELRQAGLLESRPPIGRSPLVPSPDGQGDDGDAEQDEEAAEREAEEERDLLM